jgi:hypothetical protein
MFGIDLSPGAKQLIAEVEKAFGKPMLEQEVATWEPGHYGEASVAPDGRPTVTINSATGRTEATIVHEVFHLKLRAEGFAILGFEFPPGKNTQANREFMSWISHHLRDPIQHSIFYPLMRKMGADPDAELKTEFDEALKRNDFLGLSDATKREALALYYLKAGLQLNDAETLQRIKSWYKKKGWRDALKLGKKLLDVVLEARPTTPEDEIVVFVRCMNLLLGRQAKFKLSGWEDVAMGTFNQRGVVIKILPP